VAFTNQWSNTLPARVDGGYYIRYVSVVAWGHFEAR
jgi:endoglucanase